MKTIITLFLLFIFTSAYTQHHDWPMWRFNHERSASTPEQLADNLYLQWQSQYSARTPVWDDPLNQNLMPYDRIFEPIVVDNKIFLGFNDQDKVIALDLNTGNEIWHYYADGPVRLPLASNNGKIYFTSDDGSCYCIDASTGSLVWKRLLAPGSNLLLGNKRLISMWPARGGIVIKDNIIYTAASIWPMMGTFIYALDAGSGDVIWKNEGSSDNYILQPHNYSAFAGIGPQGTFAISGDKLLVAGGRTVPGAFDLKTGRELYFRLAEGKQTGGSFITCNDNVYFNHNRKRITFMYSSEDGSLIKQYKGEYPVIDNDKIYFSGNKITATLQKGKVLDTLWVFNAQADKDLIKAGNCLYAADSTEITAIKIINNIPQKLWSIKTGKTIERLVAANGKLIAVSNDGAILVFGDSPVKTVANHKVDCKKLKSKSSPADEIIKSTNISSGYALVFGIKDPALLEGLIARTQLNVIAFDNDISKINSMREYFDLRNVKSARLSFLKYNDDLTLLPKYLSSLTIINDPQYLNGFNKENLNAIYESVRPYGGKIWISANSVGNEKLKNTVNELNLYGAVTETNKNNFILTREGALDGASNWTHNYGSIANTVKSDDDIVRAPLGLLWFGGNSNLDVLPRHGHGPSEQIMDGRLIIEGINCISARDVYTGRVLWKKVFDKLKEDSYDIYYDQSYDEENPLVAQYNQEHLPGVNARGTNFVVTKEYVYLIEGSRCNLLDIKTGDLVNTFTTGSSDTKDLGYIGIYGDFLILGNNYSDFPDIKTGDEKEKDAQFEKYDVTASRELMVMNRFSGEKLWSLPAKFGFIHNSVVAGDDKLFCLDKLPVNLESKLKRRGEEIPQGTRLLFIDLKTGNILHQETDNIFGSWLGYSAKHQLLVQATTPSSDALAGEDGDRMIVYDISAKKILWDKAFKYNNPPIIHNEKIYTSGDSFSLFTGDPILEKDFITGEDVKWNFKREYGCNYIIASEHLLTFRSTSAGFVNLITGEGTGNFGGFKSGCTPNLIAANGVLNAPDYTRTCQCSYQNQTSLALVPMPWMNYWTTTTYKWSGKQVRQLGLNLNAPGDRVADNNTLWLDFPSVGGISPDIPVKIDSVNYFKIRKNAISIDSEASPWISASAVGGIRSLEITLSKENDVPETTYRVRLYFAELENKKAGERVFNLSLQGKNVLENFDIVAEAGKSDKEVIKSFSGIKAGKVLKIEMTPVTGNTILSGIELVQESVAVK